jgi:transcriptional regulator of heat shock response
MAAAGTLGARKGEVLRAVVSHHIRTGEPVGSGAVVRRYRLGVSPATIRNDMSALEEMGFLVQPHTSAGRVPTDRGYRFYVDALPRRPVLSEQQQRVITAFFGEPPPDLEEALRRTASLLSKVTRYGAVTQPPGAHHVFIGGAANIAAEETFERRETARRLFELLEEHEDSVLALLRSLWDREDVTVRIGRENSLVAMREASLVVAPYLFRGRPAGTIAVIGPTRMHYSSATSAVEAVSTRLSGLVETLAG